MSDSIMTPQRDILIGSRGIKTQNNKLLKCPIKQKNHFYQEKTKVNTVNKDNYIYFHQLTIETPRTRNDTKSQQPE